MDNDIISRSVVLDYLKSERGKLIDDLNSQNNVIPIHAIKGSLLTIKAMMCFITQMKPYDDENITK